MDLQEFRHKYLEVIKGFNVLDSDIKVDAVTDTLILNQPLSAVVAFLHLLEGQDEPDEMTIIYDLLKEKQRLTEELADANRHLRAIQQVIDNIK